MNNEEIKKKLLDIIDQIEEQDEEESDEIPASVLNNLISWLENKGISETDIVDCLTYICQE